MFAHNLIVQFQHLCKWPVGYYPNWNVPANDSRISGRDCLHLFYAKDEASCCNSAVWIMFQSEWYRLWNIAETLMSIEYTTTCTVAIWLFLVSGNVLFSILVYAFYHLICQSDRNVYTIWPESTLLTSGSDLILKSIFIFSDEGDCLATSSCP